MIDDLAYLRFIFNRSIVFQMKNRKQRVPQNNRPNLITQSFDQNELTATHIKEPSTHAKISTNSHHHPHEKRNKNKKNPKSSSKDQLHQVHSGQHTSKSGRKVKKYDLPLKVEDRCLLSGQVSYREYCLVDNNFVPITDDNHQKMLDEMFAKTASTTLDKNYFNQVNKQERVKLRRKSISSQQSHISIPKVPKVETNDKSVSNIHQKINLVSTEVEATVENCEIGLQYSQRKQICEEQSIKKQDQNSVKSGQESLSDILFKLQFTHLGDQQSFNYLNSNEKEHFTQLLESVITKLKPKPNSKDKLKPISFEGSGSESRYCSPEQQSPKAQQNDEKLQGLIMMREYVQLNYIEDPNDYEDNKVNTSLLSILNFLGHLFCQVQINYAEQFVYMIRKMYGLTFREKYRRITRDIPIVAEKKFRVIDEALFEDMVNDSDGSSFNYHEIVHFKAVFDAFNEHLEEYRPYYLGNGQQFPWAFKMFITMSEYSIDEQSLQIIFRQAKDKIVEWATLLCGLHVQYDQILKQNNLLEQKRTQKENKLISSWIKEQNFFKDGIQLHATQSLHQVSEMIYQQLLEEVVAQEVFN